jgi:hypothetical protein
MSRENYCRRVLVSVGSLLTLLFSAQALAQSELDALSNLIGNEYLKQRNELASSTLDLPQIPDEEYTNTAYSNIVTILRDDPEQYEMMEGLFDQLVRGQQRKRNPYSTANLYYPGLDTENALYFYGERLLKAESFYREDEQIELQVAKCMAALGLAGFDSPVSRTILVEALKAEQSYVVVDAIQYSLQVLANEDVVEKLRDLIAVTQDPIRLDTLEELQRTISELVAREQPPTTN